MSNNVARVIIRRLERIDDCFPGAGVIDKSMGIGAKPIGFLRS